MLSLSTKKEKEFTYCFWVEDIRAEIERLKSRRFVFISEEPKDGADNKLVVFLHPKSTNGVLVELCQEKTLIFFFLNFPKNLTFAHPIEIKIFYHKYFTLTQLVRVADS